MSSMEKITCPKCRRILFKYRGGMIAPEGVFEIFMKCPSCGTKITVDLTAESLGKKEINKLDASTSDNKLKDFDEL